MLKQPIAISSFASISPLGTNAKTIWESYLQPDHCFLETEGLLTGSLPEDIRILVEEIALEKKQYRPLDKTVLATIFAGRQAMTMANWDNKKPIGINIGSSRGATHLFERYYTEFTEKGQLGPKASPTTTLGNLSTWLAHDLGAEGFHFSHSITCSTALHALLNGLAWLQSGMADQFIVGSAEAPITPFTLAQMKALKIYAAQKTDFPCRSLDFEKQENTMILGEGAAVFCLSNNLNQARAKIISVGYGAEKIKHGADISADGQCFQTSMTMAIEGMNPADIDAIVMHAPGTVKGDKAEMIAVERVFKNNLPAITSNKWKIGHALGASGGLSLEMAILMLEQNQLIESPYYKNTVQPAELKNIMVNAVGFGGNAVSVVVSI